MCIKSAAVCLAANCLSSGPTKVHSQSCSVLKVNPCRWGSVCSSVPNSRSKLLPQCACYLLGRPLLHWKWVHDQVIGIGQLVGTPLDIICSLRACRNCLRQLYFKLKGRGIGYSFQLAITAPLYPIIGYCIATAQSCLWENIIDSWRCLSSIGLWRYLETTFCFSFKYRCP